MDSPLYEHLRVWSRKSPKRHGGGRGPWPAMASANVLSAHRPALQRDGLLSRQTTDDCAWHVPPAHATSVLPRSSRACDQNVTAAHTSPGPSRSGGHGCCHEWIAPSCCSTSAPGPSTSRVHPPLSSQRPHRGSSPLGGGGPGGRGLQRRVPTRRQLELLWCLSIGSGCPYCVPTR